MSGVAVVDDDAAIRQLLTQALQAARLRVRAFADGATALAGLAEEPCDLLLVDYQLPDMTGLELTVAVRAHDPDLPVALVTGSAHLVPPEAMAAAGIARVFPKPFDLDELLGWVQAQLR